ncbi:hypothetical protein KR100_07690 [Synechococcus sp. KORDI-100]|nr:hypothetical protein KR100_07690 [Synechococcus sp. KORDI-100]
MDKETVELADLLATDTVNYITNWAEEHNFTYDEALYDIVCTHRLNRRLKESSRSLMEFE